MVIKFLVKVHNNIVFTKNVGDNYLKYDSK